MSECRISLELDPIKLLAIERAVEKATTRALDLASSGCIGRSELDKHGWFTVLVALRMVIANWECIADGDESRDT